MTNSRSTNFLMMEPQINILHVQSVISAQLMVLILNGLVKIHIHIYIHIHTYHGDV